MSGRLFKVEDWEKLARDTGFQPATLADICDVSLRQLERFFDSRFHQTPNAWLRNLQCHLAKDLISHGYSSKAAALEVGFASQSHFCREFKKVFGAPPQTFAPPPGKRAGPDVANRQ